MTVPRSRSAEQQTEVEGALSGARTRPDFPPVALHDEPDGDADASPPITPQKAEVLKVDHGADDNAGKHARDEEWRKMALSLAATLDAEEAARDGDAASFHSERAARLDEQVRSQNVSWRDVALALAEAADAHESAPPHAAPPSAPPVAVVNASPHHQHLQPAPAFQAPANAAWAENEWSPLHRVRSAGLRRREADVWRRGVADGVEADLVHPDKHAAVLRARRLARERTRWQHDEEAREQAEAEALWRREARARMAVGAANRRAANEAAARRSAEVWAESVVHDAADYYDRAPRFADRARYVSRPRRWVRPSHYDHDDAYDSDDGYYDARLYRGGWRARSAIGRSREEREAAVLDECDRGRAARRPPPPYHVGDLGEYAGDRYRPARIGRFAQRMGKYPVDQLRREEYGGRRAGYRPARPAASHSAGREDRADRSRRFGHLRHASSGMRGSSYREDEDTWDAQWDEDGGRDYGWHDYSPGARRPLSSGKNVIHSRGIKVRRGPSCARPPLRPHAPSSDKPRGA